MRYFDKKMISFAFYSTKDGHKKIYKKHQYM